MFALLTKEKKHVNLIVMKKKAVRHVRHHRARALRANTKNYFVMVRGWMFIVMFAIMLGVGAVIGTYLNTLMNASTPQVAGVSTER